MPAEPMTTMMSAATGPVPLREVRIDALADGCLFEVAVEQRYANAESSAIEAVYTFPLPLQAVLLGFELQIGERRLKGVVQPKRDAAERYEDAVAAGDSAALLEEARPGLYAVSVGNLRPGEEAVVRFRYAQLLDFEQGRVRLCIPTAVAPRYGAPMRAVAVHQVPVTDPRASYPCSLTMRLRGALARAQVHSPTHRLVTQLEDGGLRLVTPGGCVLDRDLVVLIEGLSAQAQGVVARDGEGYVALASMTVPARPSQVRTPRAVKLLVDCSGSMDGNGIGQARDALSAAVGSLSREDRVSLTCFGTAPRHLTAGLESAAPAGLQRLDGAIRGLRANLGGTEMQAAVVATLEIPVPGECRADILMITDGEIWEIDALVERLASSQHRLFVIAVGASPAEELARRVVAITGGACEFVTPDEDMGGAVARLLAKMASTEMTIEAIRWPGATVWTTGPGRTLYAGDTVHLLAGFAAPPSTQLQVVFAGADGKLCELPLVVAAEDTLARVAAARRLAGLQRPAATTLATQYQLVTQYTSCAVVLERPDADLAQGLPELRRVPQMLDESCGRSAALRPRGVAAGPPPAGAAERVYGDYSAPAMLRTAPRCPPAPQGAPPTRTGDWDATTLAAPTVPAGGKRIARLLAERADRGEALPATLLDLAALGVEDTVLARLRELVAAGEAEADVVAAWLAHVALQSRDELPPRLVARLQRSADRELTRRVALALTEVAAPPGGHRASLVQRAKALLRGVGKP